MSDGGQLRAAPATNDFRDAREGDQAGMSAALWLEVGDQFILDDADYVVSRVIIGRTDRVTFQQVGIYPSLGGESRQLLQVEGNFFAVAQVPLEDLHGEQVTVGEHTLRLRWEAEVRTEMLDAQGQHRFGLGRCAYYEGEDDSVALRVKEADEGYAVVGTPLDPSRIDLRFT